MSQLAIRFRVFTGTLSPQVAAAIDYIQTSTALLFKNIDLDIVYPEPVPIACDVLDLANPVDPYNVSPELMARLQSYRPAGRPCDVVVYVFEIDTCDGFTNSQSPDISLDLSRVIDCTWVLAHELGHLLGSFGHDQSPKRMMYSSPGNIQDPPPNFKPGSGATYRASQYSNCP